jgi:hypothetical protein
MADQSESTVEGSSSTSDEIAGGPFVDLPDDTDLPHEPSENIIIKACPLEVVAFFTALKMCHRMPDKAYQNLFGWLSKVTRSPHAKTVFEDAARDGIKAHLPFKPAYVSFCHTCDRILDSSHSLILLKAVCGVCGSDYTNEVKSGFNLILVYSVREQLESYFRTQRFPRLLDAFRPLYRELHKGRPDYERLIDEDSLSLMLFCDSAPMTKNSGVSLFPGLLFINNIPVASQCRYPILGAVSCSSGHMPSSR